MSKLLNVFALIGYTWAAFDLWKHKLDTMDCAILTCACAVSCLDCIIKLLEEK